MKPEFLKPEPAILESPLADLTFGFRHSFDIRHSALVIRISFSRLHLKRISGIRSLYHWKSFLPAASKCFVEKMYLTGYRDVALNHLCISECPSAKENPHAPSW